MRLCIIGYSGAGKSTLARALGEVLDVPVLHLDAVHWLPGWQERPDEEGRAMVNNFLDRNGSWVIEGNYSALCFDRRMAEADKIIFLDLPCWLCFRRAFGRYLRYRGRTRTDMGPGCPEKFDLEFAWWLLWAGRGRRRRRAWEALFRRWPEKLILCRRADEARAEAVLSRLGPGRTETTGR